MPKLDIIDAHHHIWRQADQPWLNGPTVPRIFGPYDAIRRDYPIAEYLADIKDNGVIASVYVQTNWELVALRRGSRVGAGDRRRAWFSACHHRLCRSCQGRMWPQCSMPCSPMRG